MKKITYALILLVGISISPSVKAQDCVSNHTTATTSTATEKNNSLSNDIVAIKNACNGCLVRISEVFPNPKGSDDLEFIELENTSGEKVSIGGWKIMDSAKKEYILPDTITITNFFSIDKAQSGISLNNSGVEELTLFDGEGILVDTFSYSDSKEGLSYSKLISDFDWTNPSKNKINLPIVSKELVGKTTVENSLDATETVITSTIATSTATTTTLNEVATASSTNPLLGESKKNNEITVDNVKLLVISEIFPNPKGIDTKNEFIELYNPTTSTINLSGYYLDDDEGGSKPFLVKDTQILAGEYIVFLRETTGIALNNTSDKVRLLDSKNIEVISTSYKSPKEGESLSLFAGDYIWTTDVTPQEENNYIDVLPQETSALFLLEELESATEGEKVHVQGDVMVLPGELSSQYFYIQDKKGVQVYLYSKDFPSLEYGDRVVVTGEISKSSYGRRIKVASKDDIVFIGKNDLILPLVLTEESFDETTIGELVVVKGIVKTWTKNSIVIETSFGEIKGNIKESTLIAKQDLLPQQSAELTGILVKSGDSYSLLPRSQDDIKLLNISKTSTSTVTTTLPAITRSIDNSEFTLSPTIKYILMTLAFLSIGGVIYAGYQLYKKEMIRDNFIKKSLS